MLEKHAELSSGMQQEFQLYLDGGSSLFMVYPPSLCLCFTLSFPVAYFSTPSVHLFHKTVSLSCSSMEYFFFQSSIQSCVFSHVFVDSALSAVRH